MNEQKTVREGASITTEQEKKLISMFRQLNEWEQDRLYRTVKLADELQHTNAMRATHEFKMVADALLEINKYFPASKADIKRTIKRLRIVQGDMSQPTQIKQDCERAIDYIKEYALPDEPET